jgi:FkbM family methyltransferase
MDVVGGVIARLDSRAPRTADRLRWRRERESDVALRCVELLVGRGDNVLDIGAMRGLFSSRMLDLVGRRGTVQCFEPNPAHYDRLDTLARHAPLRVHRAGLSDHPGEATLSIPVVDGRPFLGWASLEGREGYPVQTLSVPILRLDDLVDPRRPIAFIKCDVEGHEDAVMRGGHSLLARDRPAVLVEIEQRHRSAPVGEAFELFARLGYEGWALFDVGLRPLDAFDLDHDQLHFLRRNPEGEVMPDGYVHNFLFVTLGTDVAPLLDPAVAPGRPTATSSSKISA